MRTTRVRIQRSRKSAGTKMLAWANFLTICLTWMLQPWIDQEKTVIQEATLEVRRTQAQINAARAQAVSNDVVIKDLKIEQLKMQNELLARKIKMLGGTADDFAPESRY